MAFTRIWILGAIILYRVPQEPDIGNGLLLRELDLRGINSNKDTRY
jgi:hypothetical protein